jgi:hypothetical protein
LEAKFKATPVPETKSEGNGKANGKANGKRNVTPVSNGAPA